MVLVTVAMFTGVRLCLTTICKVTLAASVLAVNCVLVVQIVMHAWSVAIVRVVRGVLTVETVMHAMIVAHVTIVRKVAS